MNINILFLFSLVPVVLIVGFIWILHSFLNHLWTWLDTYHRACPGLEFTHFRLHVSCILSLRHLEGATAWVSWNISSLLYPHPNDSSPSFWRTHFDVKSSTRQSLPPERHNLSPSTISSVVGAVPTQFDFEDIAQFSSCNAVLFDRCGSSANPVCFWRAWHSLACNAALTFEGPASPRLIPKAGAAVTFLQVQNEQISVSSVIGAVPSLILRT